MKMQSWRKSKTIQSLAEVGACDSMLGLRHTWVSSQDGRLKPTVSTRLLCIPESSCRGR